jgi:ribosomal-protein-alanine N-acetyltransferase
MIDTIRLADGTADDLDGVMLVMTAAFDPAFGEAWTRSQCAGILPMTGVSLMLAREANGAPLGFALFRIVAAEAELLLLAVSPNRRVHLEVRDGNPAAAMYRSAGFTAAGRRRGYYRGETGQFDAITFARQV